MKSIYVGNLVYSASEEQVKELFEQFGEVSAVRLISDKQTGKKKGFGFVEMEDDSALKAIDALEGKEFAGRTLRVNEAKPRAPRPPKRGGKD